jgi:hypothetical protein
MTSVDVTLDAGLTGAATSGWTIPTARDRDWALLRTSGSSHC